MQLFTMLKKVKEKFKFKRNKQSLNFERFTTFIKKNKRYLIKYDSNKFLKREKFLVTT